MMARLGLFFFLFVASSAQACSCSAPSPICAAFGESPAIFRGRVLEITLIRPPLTVVKNLDGTTSSLLRPGKYRVRFSVSETFRGDARNEMTVYTAEQSSACGFPFVNGTEYVVFAGRDKTTGELLTTKCSHTHASDPSKQDADVSWMRGMSKAPEGATIFGALQMPDGTSSLDSQVSVRGTESRDLVPDERGRYSAGELWPGKYTVSVRAPSGFSIVPDVLKVSVENKGCAEVDWPVSYDGHIRGRVTDTGRMLRAGIVMELLRSGVDSREGAVGYATTDAEGRYDFSQVPPGEYIVVANQPGPSPTRPYPRVYFPNAEARENATAVRLEASRVLENIDLVLPRAWKPVLVHTKVLMEDGSPAADANVDAFDTAALWSVEPASSVTDSRGEAALAVYEGRTYYLTGRIQGGTQQRCGGPLQFTAKGGMTLSPIRIEHDRGNCLAHLSAGFRPSS